MTRILAATLALLLLAGALLPAAFADHVYSHRYVVVGRLVDADGAPIEGAGVSVGGSLRADGTCDERPEGTTDAWGAEGQSVTDARGEFRLCFHVHVIPLDPDARITVSAASVAGEPLASARVPVDSRMRATFVGLVSDRAIAGDAASPIDASYLVVGRVWAPWARDQPLENVNVHGLALEDKPVVVSVTDANGTKREVRTATNGYGDFAVRVPVDAAPERVRVQVGEDIVEERAADPMLRFSAFKIEAPPVAEVFLLAVEQNETFAWRVPRGEVDNPTITVLPNATVTVFAVNAGEAPHRFETEGGPSGETVMGRGNYTTYTVRAPVEGEFAYFCAIHPDMRGTFAVDPAAYVAPLHEDEPPAPTSPPATTPAPTPEPTGEAETTPTPTSPSPTPGLPFALVALALLGAAAGARRRR